MITNAFLLIKTSKISNEVHVYIDVTHVYIRTPIIVIHVYINAGPLPFKSQIIAYIMKRNAIYNIVQSKYTRLGSSACMIYYSSIEINTLS